ncbi:MAG TPA: protein translocase subunit SecF [Jatrophihabitans sp.]|jgi:preprotein translocase subunit SecF
MSVFTRLYRGETRYDFIGHRKYWYIASAVIVLIALLSIIFRGFNYGIEFKGGTQFQVPVKASVSVDDVRKAFADAGVTPESTQQVGSGGERQIIVKTETLASAKQLTVKQDAAKNLKLNSSDITLTSVSSSWGHDISVKAIEGLIIFLIAVSIYISIRYEWRMAIGALAGLLHDLVVAAGIYSIVGFEVTPSTVVGLLTILGFSLYDTVVVYDKVAENTKDILTTARMTYSEAANLAVNQTLMRSINTSLISLLPVAGLLFVGVGLMGVGTLQDLALILFVGLASGAYSSLFLCTPVVVDLTERDPKYQALTRRVLARRASDAKKGADGGQTDYFAEALAPRRRLATPAAPPKPGAKPQIPRGAKAPRKKK